MPEPATGRKSTKKSKGASKKGKGTGPSKKSTKDTTSKKGAPKKRNEAGLSPNQVTILKAVCKSRKGLTYPEIRKATGIERGLTKMVTKRSGRGTEYPGSLEAMGLVEVHEANGEQKRVQFVVEATTKGKEETKKSK
jgi:DNA-binding MarR family transcriptional regulator